MASGATRSVGTPAFLSKLRRMVDDPETDNLICWSDDGHSFIIRNEIEFWSTLLPVYYKHNNISSFIRQLNMYGFHKIANVNDDAAEDDNTECQFGHPFFQKGDLHLMKNIKRKSKNSRPSPSETAVQDVENEDRNGLNKAAAEINRLHSNQALLHGALESLKRENSVLWNELAMLKQKQHKQHQLLNEVIQFLATVVQPNSKVDGFGVKRCCQLMLNKMPLKKQRPNSESGPIIHELNTDELIPEELFEGCIVVEQPIETEDVPSTSLEQNEPMLRFNVSETVTSGTEELLGISNLLSDTYSPMKSMNTIESFTTSSF